MSDAARETVATHRAELARAESELSQASAVLSRLETRRDRTERGVAGDDAGATVETFTRWVEGESRPGSLAFLTEPLVPADGGPVAVVDAALSPTTGDVESLVGDLRAHATGGGVGADALASSFETLLNGGTTDDVAALASLFEHVVSAARARRDAARAALNNEFAADGSLPDGGRGAKQRYLDTLDDDLSLLAEEPVAMLPVRLETRFVSPSDGDADGEYNRTEPSGPELRIRVYPDQVHVDSHEPELTADEETWAENFWAKVWFACHAARPATATLTRDRRATETVDRTMVDTDAPVLGYRDAGGAEPPTAAGETVPIWTVPYDADRLPEAVRERGVVADLADGLAGFSTDDATRYGELKERAWGQLVDRFGEERGAYLVHALAPTTDAEAMLAGWADDEAPWPSPESSSGSPGPSPNVPALSFPTIERRPGSWTRQPRARLLPDRWIAIGQWRHPDDGEDAPTNTVRATSTAVREPLAVGPSPERVGLDGQGEAATDRDVPEGMEWMVDYGAAERAGMALRITPEDLGGTDPADVVFEELVVVGVRGSMDGAESTAAIEDLLESHQYTDGLAFLDRGTPTNNSDRDAGYSPTADAAESVDVACGPPLASFGDFTDGDVLSRALGIASPGGDHVFGHVEGAGARTGTTARQLNSVLWPATIGYYLRNLLTPNRWTGLPSIWAGRESSGEQVQPESFPDAPLRALGESTKWLDGYRRHFVKYVRSGGPFPPLRIGRQPYGVLPVASLPAADEGGSLYDRIPADRLDGDGDRSVAVPDRQRRDVGLLTEGLDLGGDATGEGRVSTTGGVDGLSASGYSMAVDEPATQVDTDLYGSAYDPVVPGSSSVATPTGEDSLSMPDGGASVRTRQRSFRVDGEVAEKVGDWVRKFGGAWRASWDEVDRLGGPDGDAGETRVEGILERGATGDAFVRETLLGYDAVRASAGGDQGGLDVFTDARNRDVRAMLQQNDMTELDPRLGWMLPPLDFGPGPHRPDVLEPLLVGDHPGQYLRMLYEQDWQTLELLEVALDLEHLSVDRERVTEVLDLDVPADLLTDRQLAYHVIERGPEHGKLDQLMRDAVIEGSFGGGEQPDHPIELTQGADDLAFAKLGVVGSTDGLALQHSLFRQLTRFATVQAHVGGRIRLGLKWDEPLAQDGVDRLLSADLDGSDPHRQRPVPDPSVHVDPGDGDTRTVWDVLHDEVPGHVGEPWAGETYLDILSCTCSPAEDPSTTYAGGCGSLADQPPADPRLREFFESLQYLEQRFETDASDAERLLVETLDLASHRLDAWWTSLATRRLFEHRERQEVDLYDGAEYAFVGDHFRRGEGTAERPENWDSGSGGDGGAGLVAGNRALAVDESTVDEAALATEYGHLSSSEAVLTGQGGPGADRGPVTYVGGYGFVENLVSDELAARADVPGVPASAGAEEAEYVHTPSPQQATTAAILRSARKHHDDGESGLADLLDVDLSPGRVRAARTVLDGIRQGRLLGDLLGYRFERRLLERTRWYREHRSGSVNLVQYKFALRRAYPAVEGQLDHGGGGTADPSARSDVVDGYGLLTAWQEAREAGTEAAFFRDVDAGDGTLADAVSPAEREELEHLLDELDAIVDAVTDLLLAENVHQIGQGNFQRAGAGIDDLVKGEAVPDTQVTETPRDATGVQHRQVVLFGDDTATAWDPDTPAVQPTTLPTLSGTTTGLRGAADGSVDPDLQVRPEGEAALNAWVGDLLPAPDRVSCSAAFDWEVDRAVETGTFTTPTEPGTVSVSLEFEPDLVVLTAAHAVGERGDAPGASPGWTHGVAHSEPGGSVVQRSVSVGADLDGGEAGGRVHDDAAFAAHLHDADGSTGTLRGNLATTADGFAVSFPTAEYPDGAPAGLVVSYRAYALGDASNVEVGTFTTADSTGTQSVPFDHLDDADHVFLAGGTVPTTVGAARTTTGAAGLSHGAASADSGLAQHAAASSVDPASGDHVAGVRDDRALHLLYGSGSSLAGTTSAEVTGLGGSLDLRYHSVHAGDATDAGRVVTYVAIETAGTVPAPAVGVVDAGQRQEGAETTISTGFRPGFVEVVALPSVDATGSAAGATVGGWSHGVATGVADQGTVSHVTRPAADGAAGGHERGALLSLPAVGGDGSVTGRDEVRLSGVDDDGFTLTFGSVAGGDQPLCYRAWPAEPAAVRHVVDTGLTLDDLELSALDALYLTQQNEEAGASQLEQRMRYHLFRHRPDRAPAALPVPDDATVRLRFQELAPSATGSDPLTVAEFLEVTRAVREVVQDGRPLDAADLAHPGGETEPGHTDASAADLERRADTAQSALAATGALVDNRVARLTAPEGERPLHEDVAALHDDLHAFLDAAPVDGVGPAAARAREATRADDDALATELRTLYAHLPAGPYDAADVDADLVATPAPGQVVAGDAGVADEPVEVRAWSRSAGTWFERTADDGTDGNGRFRVKLDFGDVRPGTGFTVTATTKNDGRVRSVATGRVAFPSDAIAVRAASGQSIEGSGPPGTTLDLTIQPVDGSAPLPPDAVTTDANGEWSVTVDLSGAAPWSRFDVTTARDGDTLSETTAYVVPDPAGVVESGTVLPRLLWLAEHAPAFNPYRPDAPAGRLHGHVTGGVDWDAVEAERGLLQEVHDSAGEDQPSQADIDTVAALLDDGSGPALESLDLTAVDAAVRRALTPVWRLGVDDLFDVTGRPDRGDGLRLWYDRSAGTDPATFDRFASIAARPEHAFDDDFDAAFAPAFESYLRDNADAILPDGADDAARLVRYLAALLDRLPAVLADPAFTGQLRDPARFARNLRLLLCHPDAFPDAERGAFAADLRRLVRRPVLDRLAAIDGVTDAAGVDSPYHNLDDQLLDRSGQGDDGDDGEDDDGADGRFVVDDELTGVDTVVDPTTEASAGTGDEPLWMGGVDDDLERRDLEGLGDGFGLDTFDLSGTFAPGDSPPGDPVTDLRALLAAFRRNGLDDYLAAVGSPVDLPTVGPSPDRGGVAGVPTATPGSGASGRWAAFGTEMDGRLDTLATTTATHLGHLEAGREAGAFDLAFRRGLLETLRRGMLRASYFGIHGSTPGSPAGGTPDDVAALVPQAEAVLERIEARHDAAAALAPAPPARGGTGPTVEGQRERLEAVFGDDFRVLPPFTPTNGNELAATFGRSTALQGGDPLAAETWLQRVARLREKPATFRRALSYAEAVSGQRYRDLEVGQVPHRPDELWAGLDGEQPGPGRLSLVAQYATGFGGDFTGGQLTGLFVDELVEHVPTATQRTGVALNYDDPAATAPQSLLLAMPPEDGEWTEDALRTVLTDTMELFKLRMVDLEDLDDFGPLLPMLSFPKNEPVSGDAADAPSIDVDRIGEYQTIAGEIRSQYRRYLLQRRATSLAGQYDDIGAWASTVHTGGLDLGGDGS